MKHYQPMQANIDAQVSDVTLPLILKATAPRAEWNIGFTTAASGKVTVRWTGDGNGLDVHGDLMLSVPRNTLGLVPVSGPAHADYLGDHRHLVIQDANLHTPATQVHGVGTLDLLDKDLHSALRLDVVGRDLGEFDQLLTITDLRATPRGFATCAAVAFAGCGNISWRCARFIFRVAGGGAYGFRTVRNGDGTERTGKGR